MSIIEWSDPHGDFRLTTHTLECTVRDSHLSHISPGEVWCVPHLPPGQICFRFLRRIDGEDDRVTYAVEPVILFPQN